MDKVKKCIISKYDAAIKEPPFLTIRLDETEVLEPEDKMNDMGVTFAGRLIHACQEKGYVFKFYTISEEEGYDYKIVVYGEMEEQQAYNSLY